MDKTLTPYSAGSATDRPWPLTSLVGQCTLRMWRFPWNDTPSSLHTRQTQTDAMLYSCVQRDVKPLQVKREVPSGITPWPWVLLHITHACVHNSVTAVSFPIIITALTAWLHAKICCTIRSLCFFESMCLYVFLGQCVFMFFESMCLYVFESMCDGEFGCATVHCACNLWLFPWKQAA